MPHIPGHSRDQFIEWLNRYNWRPDDTPQGRQLIGSVWQCTDTLPGEYCQQLDVPPGSSYAQAAQGLLRSWQH